MGFYVIFVQPRNLKVGIYGGLLFFIGFLPLIGQGSSLLMLEDVDEEELYSNCFSGETELLQVADDHYEEKILLFQNLAKELDIFTETILDQKMCSEICPCYHRESNQTINDVSMMRNDARY